MNRERLAGLGILYPQSLGPVNHRRLRNFAADSHAHIMGAEVREHPGGIVGFRRQLRQEFAEEAGARAYGTLVVSDEHFHSSLGLAEIQRLRCFLEPYAGRCQVIVYLRRQDELCRSFHSEYIKTGRTGDQPLTGDSIEYYYDYRSLVQNYERVFGHGSVLARRFSKPHLLRGDIVDDFAALVGIGDIRAWPRHSRRNVALDGLALRFLEELNRHIPQSINSRLNPDRTDLRAVLEAHFPGDGWPVTRQWAIDFYDRYREINEWVRQRFFPDSASLFDEDFSRYPVTVPAGPPGFEDAVALAAVLWRHQAGTMRALQAENARLRAALARVLEQSGSADT